MHDKQLTRITQQLRRGARLRIPPQYRRTATDAVRVAGIVDDAVQEAFLRFLGRRRPSSRQANILGQTAGRTLVRREMKFAPGEVEVEIDGDVDEVGLWDAFDPSNLYRRNLSGDIEWRLHELKTRLQIQTLAAFAEECPKDYRFLMQYLTSRGKKPHSRKQRNRAGVVIAKLRRRYMVRKAEARPLFQRLEDLDVFMPAFASRLTYSLEGEKRRIVPHHRKKAETKRTEDLKL